MAAPESIVEAQVPNDARNCTVLDQSGKEIVFGQLLDNSTTKKLLLIFIRHFFCGNCQEYVRRLSTEFAPSTLPEDVSVIIIGCGAASLIHSYIQTTGCKFPIYADPTTKLYQKLGMHRTLSLGSKGPAYIRHSLASGVVKSIVQSIKRIPNGDVLQGGDFSVNGGEFLLEKDNILTNEQQPTNWNISWSHCMMNTRDHTEIDDLKCVVSSDCGSTRSDELSRSDVSI